ESENQRMTVDTGQQQHGRVAVKRVDERLKIQLGARIGHAAVLERLTALRIEWAESRLDDPFGAGDAAGEDDFLLPVLEVVVHASIEPRLRGPSVHVRGIRRLCASNGAGRPQKRFLREQTRRNLVRESVARGLRVRRADGEKPAAVEL